MRCLEGRTVRLVKLSLSSSTLFAFPLYVELNFNVFDECLPNPHGRECYGHCTQQRAPRFRRLLPPDSFLYYMRMWLSVQKKTSVSCLHSSYTINNLSPPPIFLLAKIKMQLKQSQCHLRIFMLFWRGNSISYQKPEGITNFITRYRSELQNYQNLDASTCTSRKFNDTYCRNRPTKI